VATQGNKFDVVELDAHDPGMVTYIELQNQKYNLMWSKRAYVHWIVSCGISEDSLHEAMEEVMGYLNDFHIGTED